MNISTLLSTKERVGILKHIIYKTETLTISRVASEVGLSKGLVSKYFYLLHKEDILSKVNNKFFVKDSLPTKSLKILLNLNMFDLRKIFKKYKFIKAAGFYGSFVKGTNTEESDIDLWILIDRVSEEKMAKLTMELRKKSDKIKPLYLTKEKIEVLKKDDPVFYHSLVFGSINIFGEEIETI